MQQFQIERSTIETTYLIAAAVLLIGSLMHISAILLFPAFLLFAGITVYVTHTKHQEPLIHAFLRVMTMTMILLTIVYYAYGIPTWIIGMMSVLPILWLRKHITPITLNIPLPLRLPSLPVIAITLIDLVLIATIITAQTTELRASPWQGVTAWYFLLFAISTGLLIWQSRSLTGRTQFALMALHLFAILSIPAIMYPIGYGFDAFIHRATESWIAEHGVITPKQPYYIGQYSLVVWLHHLTHISVFRVDVWLVPLLTSLLVPALSLRLAMTKQRALALLPIMYMAVPFLSLHLTTPHNMTMLLTLVVILLSLDKKTKPLIFLFVGLAAAATHPLVGAPALLYALGHIALPTLRLRWTAALVALSTMFALPVMFTLNQVRSGRGLPNITNPLGRIREFLDLFAQPYWYLDQAPFYLDVLYAWQRALHVVLLALASYGVWAYRKHSHLLLLPVTSLGLFLSAWLLRSWFVFPDIIAYEQGDFPLRLIKAAMLFLLPHVTLGLGAALQRIKIKSSYRHYAYPSLAAIGVMLSVYFTYPQVNAKVQFPGYNVTGADVAAVRHIDSQQDNYDYIVLSNQLTAAAALQAHSFAKYHQTSDGSEHFYYAIPTGGKLYAHYLDFLYKNQKPEYVLAAMDYAHVDTAYVLVSDFWKNAPAIVEGAKKTADAAYPIDEGKIWLFRYDR